MLVSPHLIDLILAFTILEAAVLGLWRRHQSGVISARKTAPRDVTGTAPGLDFEAGTRSASQLSGPSPLAQYRDIGLMLLPGVFLLVALRGALAGAAWPWVPSALTAALVAHLLDVRQRWLG